MADAQNGEKRHILDTAWGRHILTILGMTFVAGGLWTAAQNDLARAQQDINTNSTIIGEIRRAVGDINIDAAKARVQVERLQKDVETLQRNIEELNKKLDTLLWRTSPYNPRNQPGGDR